jgi:hypothetical protein
MGKSNQTNLVNPSIRDPTKLGVSSALPHVSDDPRTAPSSSSVAVYTPITMNDPQVDLLCPASWWKDRKMLVCDCGV